jgi:hypothetical protein
MGNHLKFCDYQQKLRQFSINKGSPKKILFIGKAFKKMALVFAGRTPYHIPENMDIPVVKGLMFYNTTGIILDF